MKKMSKGAGIMLLVCAVLIYILAGIGEDAAQGTKVSTGIMVNGQYQEISSGYMGYNAQAKEDMGWLKGIAVVVGLSGGVALIASTKMKEEEPPQY